MEHHQAFDEVPSVSIEFTKDFALRFKFHIKYLFAAEDVSLSLHMSEQKHLLMHYSYLKSKKLTFIVGHMRWRKPWNRNKFHTEKQKKFVFLKVQHISN